MIPPARNILFVLLILALLGYFEGGLFSGWAFRNGGVDGVMLLALVILLVDKL